MDRLDLKLLSALQRDASCTNAALAEAVGLSPSSSLRRVQKLKKNGAITKIVALVEPAALGRVLMAIVEVELDRHGAQQMRSFLNQASDEPAVTHAYAVSGEVDVVLIMRLVDMTDFQDICERLFRNDNGVARFRTLFVTQTAKEDTAIPVDYALTAPRSR